MTAVHGFNVIIPGSEKGIWFIIVISTITIIGLICVWLFDEGLNEIETYIFKRLRRKNPDIIFCGDVWFEGRIINKKTFKGLKSKSFQFISDDGSIEGPCHKVAENFFLCPHPFETNGTNEIIGYCNEHMPNCSCKYPGGIIIEQEAYDLIIVQKVMNC